MAILSRVPPWYTRSTDLPYDEAHFFLLHFFVPHGFGDLIAVHKMKATCGVSAKKPCHQCHIKGVRDNTGTGQRAQDLLRTTDSPRRNGKSL
jgi:hypothetical protein